MYLTARPGPNRYGVVLQYGISRWLVACWRMVGSRHAGLTTVAQIGLVGLDGRDPHLSEELIDLGIEVHRPAGGLRIEIAMPPAEP